MMRDIGMFFKVFVATAILKSSVSEVTSQGGTPSIRSISLDDLVPDVKLTLRQPLKYLEYRFDLPEELKSNSNDRTYGISLYLSNRQNTFGDISIEKTDVNGTVANIQWNSGSAGTKEIDGAVALLVKISNSTWDNENTSVTLVSTVYFDSKSPCPDDYLTCMEYCRSDSKPSKEHRCISSDLKDNGRRNCGSQEECDVHDKDDYSDGNFGDPEADRWYDVQYLLTILLAGLFFILSPICIFIFLFYHRRMNEARNVQMERQRAVQAHQRGRDEAGSAGGYTISPNNDMPPSYEDVHDIKSPPPTFDSVLVTRDRSPLESESSSTNPPSPEVSNSSSQ